MSTMIAQSPMFSAQPGRTPTAEVAEHDLTALDWLGLGATQASAVIPAVYSGGRNFVLGDLQGFSATHLPLYAVGTSTARVALLGARSMLATVVAGSWLRATAIESISDIRTALDGTSYLDLDYDNVRWSPFIATATRMTVLRAAAPRLSLSDWAKAFGVTKQAIRNWVDADPRERPELDEAAVTLRAVAARHPDVSAWLVAPLPGSDRVPLDLIRERRWRALRAAARLRAPIGEQGPTSEMREDARSRRVLSKQLGGADALPASDDEE